LFLDPSEEENEIDLISKTKKLPAPPCNVHKEALSRALLEK
jgi:hypothetical protein